MTRLTNAWLDFILDPDPGTFFLESRKFPGASLKNARFNLSFSSISGHPTVKLCSLSHDHREEPKIGSLDVVSALYRAEEVDLEWLVEFALPADQPLLLQRMEIRNLSEKTFHPDKLTFGDLRAGELQFSENRPQNTAFFSNG